MTGASGICVGVAQDLGDTGVNAATKRGQSKRHPSPKGRAGVAEARDGLRVSSGQTSGFSQPGSARDAYGWLRGSRIAVTGRTAFGIGRIAQRQGWSSCARFAPTSPRVMKLPSLVSTEANGARILLLWRSGWS